MTKLLIVEDDPTLRNAYETFFNREGYDVEVANDGQVGIDLATKTNPDVVILDILLPVKDGFDFLREFKGEEKHQDTKVIVLSNLNSPETKVEASSLGATRVLHKADYTPRELLEVLQETIKG